MSAKSMSWFRLYHRIVDDEKIRLLAFEDRWHFIAICCLKSDGLLDEPESSMKWRKIAVKLGIQLRELDEVKRRLSEVGLVDDDMQPVAWDELQYRSDSSTDRVRRYREKSKACTDETAGNVSVTAQETETDTETEEDNKAIALSSDCRDDDVAAMVEIYNEAGAGVWPKVARITPPRKTKCRKRLAECGGMDGWRAAMARARASPFLTGANASGWRASFDFFLQAESFTKLLEGTYDARQPTVAAKPLTGHAALIAATRSRLGPGPDGGGGEAGLPRSLDAHRDGSGVYRLGDRGH
jgi:hypothetical protein